MTENTSNDTPQPNTPSRLHHKTVDTYKQIYVFTLSFTSIPRSFMATKLPSVDLVGSQAIVSPICRHIIAFIDESVRGHLEWIF